MTEEENLAHDARVCLNTLTEFVGKLQDLDYRVHLSSGNSRYEYIFNFKDIHLFIEKSIKL